METSIIGAGQAGLTASYHLTQLNIPIKYWSATHEVTLSGRENEGFPRSFLGKDIYWWLNILGIYHATVDSRIVKRTKKKMAGKGYPLVGRKLKEVVERCGLQRYAKVASVKNGTVQLADDSTMPQPDFISSGSSSSIV